MAKTNPGKDAFMSECMQHHMKEKGKAQGQAVAICLNMWAAGKDPMVKKHKIAKSSGIIGLPADLPVLTSP